MIILNVFKSFEKGKILKFVLLKKKREELYTVSNCVGLLLRVT
jgi:hypothetical protein